MERPGACCPRPLAIRRHLRRPQGSCQAMAVVAEYKRVLTGSDLFFCVILIASDLFILLF